MKPFPEIWPTEPGLFVYHEMLVSLPLGAGVGSGPEFRTVPLHPWNPKRNKNPPPAYRLGKYKDRITLSQDTIPLLQPEINRIRDFGHPPCKTNSREAPLRHNKV